MADSTIGMLPRASQIDDDSLLLMEQQGTAMSATGKMVKDYAKAGLEANFKEDVEAANDAADRAKEAVSAVTEMTVEAHTSEQATVTKSMRNNRVNLNFGLPRGEKGEQGIQGEIGPRGPKGDPGSGLKVLGYYDSETALRDAVKSPEVGDAYGVGTEPPYDIYVFDGVTNDWKNNGPFSGGGGGGPVPDNVVTADGGAELEMDGGIGGGPYKVIFTDEEEPPLTAEDIEYNGGTVNDALEQLFTSVADGKKKIASAVSDKGVPTAEDATFQQMADNIRDIESGGDYSDATATPGDILAGKTAYTASGKVEGLIPSIQARNIMPSTQEQTITAGNYIAGTQVIRGDTNLQPVNIRKGVTLFGVVGAMESSFQATLNVTVDAGAVVTATHSGGTKVEALCTTGKVTLELPLEGKWTVTAQRGVAQYNSVVITVSSSYTATLTAEVHIVYFGTGSSLPTARDGVSATTIGNYALFAGGWTDYTGSSSTYHRNTTIAVTTYNDSLSLGYAPALPISLAEMAGASNKNYAIFAGGLRYDSQYSERVISNLCTAYDSALTKTDAQNLSQYKYNFFGTSVGSYAIFAGGSNAYAGNDYSNSVDAYNETLEKESISSLPTQGTTLAASNENYAMFYVNKQLVAYDKYLSRQIAGSPPAGASSAAKAGGYVVFYNSITPYAYDMFLTLTSTLEAPKENISSAISATLRDCAIFISSSFSVTAKKCANVYDRYLTLTNPEQLPFVIGNMAASSVGDYAIFAGGMRYTSQTASAYSQATYIYQYV